MGHVPAGPISRTGEGAHLSRRERRGARDTRAVPLDLRPEVGRLGERVAAWFLRGHGLEILSSNIVLTDGEIDLIARDGSNRVVIEVRTVTGPGDPIDAVGYSKRAKVRKLAGSARRIDYVGVGIRRRFVEIHWVPTGF